MGNIGGICYLYFNNEFMRQDIRIGGIVSDKKRFWTIHDICNPCKLIWCHAVDFIPYKSKKGNKAIVIYKRFKYSQVVFIAHSPATSPPHK